VEESHEQGTLRKTEGRTTAPKGKKNSKKGCGGEGGWFFLGDAQAGAEGKKKRGSNLEHFERAEKKREGDSKEKDRGKKENFSLGRSGGSTKEEGKHRMLRSQGKEGKDKGGKKREKKGSSFLLKAGFDDTGRASETAEKERISLSAKDPVP